jgi:signal transduction histidine kinase/CheY-like chemotaxis protein
MKLPPKSVWTSLVSITQDTLRSHAKLRLRTKFLLLLVLITSGFTCASLLVMRHIAQVQMQREIEESARNAILTFQVIQQQQQIALSHKADLLAGLAFMRGGEASTIQVVSEDPWQSEANLFALADRKGKIVALRSASPDFPLATAEEMLRSSLKEHSTAGWWLSGKRLFQVVLQPYYGDAPANGKLLGTVVVGREIDASRARDLGRLSSSQVVFRHGGDVVVSTLSAFQERKLGQLLQDRPAPNQIRIENEQLLASSTELTPGAHPALSLIVLKSYDGPMASLTRLNRLFLGFGLMAFLAGVALVVVISDRFTRPLQGLVEGVRALEADNFGHPVEAPGGDEVAQVTRALDRMRGSLRENDAQRQQLEAQLRQAQKMDAMGRLAGGVAHDFNNLLTVIKGNSSLLLEKLQPGDPFFGYTRQIESAADRAASLTRQLLAFCRMQVLQPKILDLNALVSEMCKLLRRLTREDIAFNFHAGQSLGRVKADPGQIEQVIMNLVVNAGDAMPAGGTLTIETHNVTVDEQSGLTRPPILPDEYVLLAVTDTGQGMDANTKARIFEPFFTTKEQGKGTGLGLATVYGVVKQSGGCIWVDSEPGKGARFEVYLPRVDEVADGSLPEEMVATPVRGRKTVLIAEDEDAVRELASEFVESAGYEVLPAKDGIEALVLAQRSDQPIHVLITDVVMPRMRGPELAKQLKRLRPGLKVVYMSGYLEYNRGTENFLEEGFFLQKPFSRDTLVRKVGEALKHEPRARSITRTTHG